MNKFVCMLFEMLPTKAYLSPLCLLGAMDRELLENAKDSGSESPKRSDSRKSPKKAKHAKQAEAKKVMALFGKEGEETANLLKQLRVVSDANVAGKNYGMASVLMRFVIFEHYSMILNVNSKPQNHQILYSSKFSF